MKDVEAMLAKAGPKPKQQLSSNFTNEVMMKIKTKHKPRGLAARFVGARLWFSHLSRATAVAVVVGGVGILGGVGYAAYQWITPKVDVVNVNESNDDGRREYTINSQCGEYFTGKDVKYELPKNSTLTDQDVQKVFRNTCAYDALQSFIGNTWKSDNDAESFAKKKPGDLVTIYHATNMFAGGTDNNPIFGLTIGRVKSLGDGKVTISLPLYFVDQSLKSNVQANGFSYEYYPGGKEFSRTLALASRVEAWENGQKIDPQSIKEGDLVQLVVRTQNEVKYYDDIKQNALGAQKTFDVVGMIRTDIDTKYVQSLGMNIGDPKITNQIAMLAKCPNNTQYSCVYVPGQMQGMIYDATESDVANVNKKNLRKDINDKNIKPRYLTGRITAIEGKTVTIQTRGVQALARIELPYDVVASYNASQTQTTNKLTMEIGDMAQVAYMQMDGEDALSIQPSDVLTLNLVEYDDMGTVRKY